MFTEINYIILHNESKKHSVLQKKNSHHQNFKNIKLSRKNEMNDLLMSL